MASKPRTPRDSLKAATRLPGNASKTRLRKLVCSDACGYPPLRCSRAAIDAGLPTCVCGAVLWPWDLDDVGRAYDAGHLSAEQYAAHPLVREYEHELGSIATGQAGPGRHAVDSSHFQTPEAIAAWRVARAVHEGNQSNKVRSARAARVEDPMPF